VIKISPMSNVLTQVFEEEVEKRVNERLTQYVEKISKTHGISMELLLRDVPNVSETILCRGVKKDGKRCTRRGKNGGYCDTHLVQKKNVQPVAVVRAPGPGHTHSFPPIFMRGCPACENASSSNKLIDLKGIL
jgi:uncharacterized ferredoxin-like protein